MTALLDSLIDSLAHYEQNDERPAILLLEDRIALAVALAASAVSRDFVAYSALIGRRPLFLAADRLGWELHLIHFPVEQLATDFIHLAVKHRCANPREFELGYLMMHACARVRETEVWVPTAGFGSRAWRTASRIADHYGKRLFNPLQGIALGSGITNCDVNDLIEATAMRARVGLPETGVASAC